jgi:hypothetical protein
MRSMNLRRLGQNGLQQCEGGHHCAQILAIDQDFIAVGSDVTLEVREAIPPGPGIGPKEGAVRIPRAVMIASLPEILSSLK